MNRLYVAIDGDNAGQHVGQAVLMDDVEKLHEISNRIDAAGAAVKEWVEQHGGKTISLGGDEGTFMLDPSAIEGMDELQKIYQKTSGFTVTVGTGSTLSQAGKALMAGKLMGKDIVVHYDESVEHMLADAHSKAGSEEEGKEAEKLNEHYLSHMGSEQNTPEESESEEFEGEEFDPYEQEAPSDEEEDSFEAEDEEEGEHETQPDIREDYVLHEDGPYEDGDTFEEQTFHDCPTCRGTGKNPNFGEQTEATGEEGEPKDGDIPEIGAPEEAEQEDSSQARAQEENLDQEEAVEIPEAESFEEKTDPKRLVSDVAGDGDDESVDESDLQLEDPSTSQEVSAESGRKDRVAESNSFDHGGGDLDLLSELLADAGSADDTKQRVAAILEKFKTNRDLILSMKDQSPDLYESIMLMLKNMIDMARHIAPETPEEDVPSGEPVAEPMQESMDDMQSSEKTSYPKM